jgi:hypothetical protein
MLFGHNSNVTVGTDIVHVQTEDRGARHASIDTTVHWHGRVLHRRTNKYLDLLPLDAARETTLKARVDDQHRVVLEEIRSGKLTLAFPAPPAQTQIPVVAKVSPAQPVVLKVELTNASTWLAGKHATLHLTVRDAAGQAVAGARATAHVAGAEIPVEFAATSGDDGTVTLQFEMPKLSGAEAALVIAASHGGAKGHLRFQLRAKPRT